MSALQSCAWRYRVNTSSLENLAGSLCAIGKGDVHNLVVLGVFDLLECQTLYAGNECRRVVERTFSRMTKGPLTPPTVL